MEIHDLSIATCIAWALFKDDPEFPKNKYYIWLLAEVIRLRGILTDISPDLVTS